MSRSRRNSLLALLAAVLLLACALPLGTATASPVGTRVVNGKAAPPSSFPYLAFVFFREGSDGEACSGTVVSSSLVLTAAHCVLDERTGIPRSAAGFRVITGTVDWESGERVVSTVSAVSIDPEYTPSGEHANWADAALLRLSQPIAAPPVKLATTEAWAAGTNALFAGWGKLEPSQSGPSTSLRYSGTTIQPASYCDSQAMHFDPAGQLCVLDTDPPYASACHGDSGGPLVIADPGEVSEPLEIGIASYSVSEGCDPRRPQYFTRADLVAPWVAGEIGMLAPAPVAPTLPSLGRRRAKSYARAALAEAFGGGFEARSGYSSDCEAIEASRRVCAVSWRGGRFRYAGRVTVFYAFESNKLVWDATVKVKRKRAPGPAAAVARSRPVTGVRAPEGRRSHPRRLRSRGA